MRVTRSWTAEHLLELGRSYQPAAVFAAAADLEIFDALAAKALSASEAARKLGCHPRGLRILLDALVALQLLRKRADKYSLLPGTAPFLTSNGSESILAMAQHQANCLRNWAQLASVVNSGRPAAKNPSVRGSLKDVAAFIGAMHNVSAPIADQVIHALDPIPFTCLLDLGGASGTWTISFLRAQPRAKAILFDLPHVIPMARRRIAAAKLTRRVKLVAGDFNLDPLPAGADLAWVSAIVHQNSRDQNRALFRKVIDALRPGGTIAIRDIIMDAGRTSPAAGALFALNMLSATPAGGTFTFDELREDVESAGFTGARIQRRDDSMNAIVVARKPAVAPRAEL